MVVFFEFPVIIIVILLLAAIGFVDVASSTVLLVALVTVALTYWLIFYIDSIMRLKSVKSQGKKTGIILIETVIVIIGFLISAFSVSVLQNYDGGIKTLFFISIFASIVQLVVLLPRHYVKKYENNFFLINLVSDVAMCALIVILCMWTIGFDLSYPIKTDYMNTAYYQCTELKVESRSGKVFSSYEELHNWAPGRLNGDIYDTYGSDVTDISNEHIIGTYEVGDCLTPNLKKRIISHENGIISYWETSTWYPVITSSGESGYTPATGMAVYYYRDSEIVAEATEKKISRNWYRIFPKAFLDTCVSFFESQPYQFSCNFADEN